MRFTRSLPLASIWVDRLPTKGVLELVEYLKAGGEVPPIHVLHPMYAGLYDFKRPPQGAYGVLDGRHRVMAFKLLGRTHIPARYGIEDLDVTK